MLGTSRAEWTFFGIKLAIHTVVLVGVAWGISFWVADYVTDKALRGFESSVAGLNTSVKTLSDNVRSVNTELSKQIVDMRKEREAINAAFIKQLEQLRGGDRIQQKDIDYLKDGMQEIKASIEDLKTAWAPGLGPTNGIYVTHGKDSGTIMYSISAEDLKLPQGGWKFQGLADEKGVAVDMILAPWIKEFSEGITLIEGAPGGKQ